MRGQLLQRLRRRLKKRRMRHAERREDMRRHIVLESLAAHPLHDVAAQSDRIVRIFRNGAGREQSIRLVFDEKFP